MGWITTTLGHLCGRSWKELLCVRERNKGPPLPPVWDVNSHKKSCLSEQLNKNPVLQCTVSWLHERSTAGVSVCLVCLWWDGGVWEEVSPPWIQTQMRGHASDFSCVVVGLTHLSAAPWFNVPTGGSVTWKLWSTPHWVTNLWSFLRTKEGENSQRYT